MSKILEAQHNVRSGEVGNVGSYILVLAQLKVYILIIIGLIIFEITPRLTST